MFGGVKRAGHALFGGMFDGQPGAFSQHDGGLQALLGMGGRVPAEAEADPWAQMVAMGNDPQAGKVPGPPKPREPGAMTWGDRLNLIGGALKDMDPYSRGGGNLDAAMQTVGERRERRKVEDMFAGLELSPEDRYAAEHDPLGFLKDRRQTRALQGRAEALARSLWPEAEAPAAPEAGAWAEMMGAPTGQAPTLETMTGGDVDWPQAPAATGVYTPEDVDYMVRTAWGEARNQGPQGLQGVGAVIGNRARQSGLSVRDVVTAPSQFSPWGDPKVRAQMEALDPNSPEYQSILEALRPVLAGEDPTGGADHFYNPDLASPSWGQGAGQMIGDHKFMRLGYSGAGVPRVAQAAADQGQPVAARVPAPRTAPQAPAPQAPAGPGTEGERRLIQAQLASGDPAQVAEAVARMEKIRDRSIAPPEYEIEVTPQGQRILSPKGGGAPIVERIPGFEKAAPAGYERDAAGGLSPEVRGPAYFGNAQAMRQDLEKDPAFRGYQRSVAIYDSLKKSYGANNRVADLDFVYGLAIIFDPDSVVREGEMVMVKNAASLPDKIKEAIGKVNANQGLSPELRAQVMAAAGNRIQGTSAQIAERQEFYRGVAKRAGLDPRDVLPPVPEFKLWSPPKAPAPVPKLQVSPAQEKLRKQFAGSKAPAGTEGNPYFLNPNKADEGLASIPDGAWYVDAAGSRKQKPKGQAAAGGKKVPPPKGAERVTTSGGKVAFVQEVR